MPENDTPFGRSLPVKAIKGSNPPPPSRGPNKNFAQRASFSQQS